MPRTRFWNVDGSVPWYCGLNITDIIRRTIIMRTFTVIPIIAVLITGSGAYAQINSVADGCFPVERAIDRLKTTNLKPDRRDTVDSFLVAHFVDVEKRSVRMNLYLKHDGIREDFVVSDSGEVEEFHGKVFGAQREAVICGSKREDGKIGIIMSPSVQFINRSGQHTMTEILDGVKDGKSHHKKNLGGAKAMFVPKMTHIAIVYDSPDVTPNVSVTADGESVPAVLEPYGEMWVIDVEALEDSYVETITIDGGFYELFPVPSIKKMKSLGIN